MNHHEKTILNHTKACRTATERNRENARLSLSGVEVFPVGRDTYVLERFAVAELQEAKRADVADAIFARFAQQVPLKDRLAVWQAACKITL